MSIADFVLENWHLLALVSVFFFGFVWSSHDENTKANFRLSVEDLVEKINRDAAAVIDLRDQNAYRQGSIAGALSWPDLSKAFSKILRQKLAKRPVVYLCDRGLAAKKIAKKMKQLEQQDSYYLQGGLNAWKKAAMPIKKN